MLKLYNFNVATIVNYTSIEKFLSNSKTSKNIYI